MLDVTPDAKERPRLDTCQNHVCANDWIEPMLFKRVLVGETVVSFERIRFDRVRVSNCFLITCPTFIGRESRKGKSCCTWSWIVSTHRPIACVVLLPRSTNIGTIASIKSAKNTNTTQKDINIAITCGTCHFRMCHLLKYTTNGERRRETNMDPPKRKITDLSV